MKMKRINTKRNLWVYVILAGMAIVGGLTACTKEDPKPEPVPVVESIDVGLIIGEWQYIAQTYQDQRVEFPVEEFMSFTADGKFLGYGDLYRDILVDPGTYQILTYENKDYVWIHSYVYENAGPFLIETLTQNDLVLRLVEGENQTMILKRRQTSTTINYAEAIVGRWALQSDETNRTWEMESDGTMHYITDDATVNGSYEISGNQLNVDCGPYEGTFQIIHISPLSMILYFDDSQNGGNYYRFNKITE